MDLRIHKRTHDNINTYAIYDHEKWRQVASVETGHSEFNKIVCEDILNKMNRYFLENPSLADEDSLIRFKDFLKKDNELLKERLDSNLEILDFIDDGGYTDD